MATARIDLTLAAILYARHAGDLKKAAAGNVGPGLTG